MRQLSKKQYSSSTFYQDLTSVTRMSRSESPTHSAEQQLNRMQDMVVSGTPAPGYDPQDFLTSTNMSEESYAMRNQFRQTATDILSQGEEDIHTPSYSEDGSELQYEQASTLSSDEEDIHTPSYSEDGSELQYEQAPTLYSDATQTNQTMNPDVQTWQPDQHNVGDLRRTSPSQEIPSGASRAYSGRCPVGQAQSFPPEPRTTRPKTSYHSSGQYPVYQAQSFTPEPRATRPNTSYPSANTPHFLPTPIHRSHSTPRGVGLQWTGDQAQFHRSRSSGSVRTSPPQYEINPGHQQQQQHCMYEDPRGHPVQMVHPNPMYRSSPAAMQYHQPAYAHQVPAGIPPMSTTSAPAAHDSGPGPAFSRSTHTDDIPTEKEFANLFADLNGVIQRLQNCSSDTDKRQVYQWLKMVIEHAPNVTTTQGSHMGHGIEMEVIRQRAAPYDTQDIGGNATTGEQKEITKPSLLEKEGAASAAACFYPTCSDSTRIKHLCLDLFNLITQHLDTADSVWKKLAERHGMAKVEIDDIDNKTARSASSQSTRMFDSLKFDNYKLGELKKDLESIGMTSLIDVIQGIQNGSDRA